MDRPFDSPLGLLRFIARLRKLSAGKPIRIKLSTGRKRELITSAGLRHTFENNRSHIYRRINQYQIERYDQIYPYLSLASLLGSSIPDAFDLIMQEASSEAFVPVNCLTRIEDVCEKIDMPLGVDVSG